MARVNDILSTLLGTGIFDVYLTGRRWGYWPCWADWLVVIGCLIASILWSRRLPTLVSAAITLAAVGGVLAVGAFSGWDVTLTASTTAAVVCLLLGYLAGGFWRRWRVRKLDMERLWPPELVASVADIVRLRAECNIPLVQLRRGPGFLHDERVIRHLPLCMRQSQTQGEFRRCVQAINSLVMESVDPRAWPPPSAWGEDQKVFLAGPNRHPFVERLARLRRWARTRNRKLVGDIFARWMIPLPPRNGKPAVWRQAHLALVEEAADFLEELHFSLAELVNRAR